MKNSKIFVYAALALSAFGMQSCLDYDTPGDEFNANQTIVPPVVSSGKADVIDYKKVISRNYPYVKLNAGYDFTYNKYDTNSYLRRSNWGGSAGITIGFNLWDGNRRREKRNARIEIENARLQRNQLELALKADLGNLWQAYRNNLQLLALEKHNVVTARENHEIAKERYMLGDLSGFEMREAQKSLLDAEERLLSVEYDTKICEISLMQLSGNIKELLK